MTEQLSTQHIMLRWDRGKVLVGKNPPPSAGDIKRCRFDPWVGKIPWRRVWQPIPEFLPGKSHGQRGLEGYSPWGLKESDTTERLIKHAHIYLKSQ